MMLTDQNGNPLPTAVNLSAVGDGLEVFATDNDGVPLQCIWTLNPRGGSTLMGIGSTSITVFGVGPSFFGSLEGFQSETYAPVITVGPSTSTVYLPPDQSLYDVTIDVVLTAVPVNGFKARSIYINVAKQTPAI